MSWPEQLDDRGLTAMCHYGASQFHQGRCKGVQFIVMPNEVDWIRAHMKERHPEVPFSLNYPDFSRSTVENGLAGPADLAVAPVVGD